MICLVCDERIYISFNSTDEKLIGWLRLLSWTFQNNKNWANSPEQTFSYEKNYFFLYTFSFFLLRICCSIPLICCAENETCMVQIKSMMHKIEKTADTRVFNLFCGFDAYWSIASRVELRFIRLLACLLWFWEKATQREESSLFFLNVILQSDA